MSWPERFRPKGLPKSGVAGFDETGFTLVYEQGVVQVFIGTDEGERIGFVMQPDVAGRFFRRGQALMDEIVKAELRRRN